MKFKEVLEKIKIYAPLGVSLVVAACVVISLSGYQTKASEPLKDKKQQVSESVTDTKTETDNADEDTQAATGSFDLADGVYKGSATGFRGPVTVAVTIMDKKITSIDILSATDDEAFFNRGKGCDRQDYIVTVLGCGCCIRSYIQLKRHNRSSEKCSDR